MKEKKKNMWKGEKEPRKKIRKQEEKNEKTGENKLTNEGKWREGSKKENKLRNNKKYEETRENAGRSK